MILIPSETVEIRTTTANSASHDFGAIILSISGGDVGGGGLVGTHNISRSCVSSGGLRTYEKLYEFCNGGTYISRISG
jgi:hypothetical protein